MRRRIMSVVSALSLAASLAVAAPALAAGDAWQAPGSTLTITEADTSLFPTVRAAYGADAVSGQEPELAYYENGERLTGVKIYRGAIGSYEDKRSADIMLVLDTSLSMGAGTRLSDAQAAARELIAQADKGDRIGLATFGGAAQVLVHPTDDYGRVTDALAGVTLANRTTLFDAVSLSSQAFEGTDRTRAIVLLSDGTDAGSAETKDEAVSEALKARAPIYAVAIRESEDVEPVDLAALAKGADGELFSVVGSSGLDALFADLGRRILQPYWIEYQSSQPVRSKLELGIAASSSTDPIATIAFRGVPSATGAGTAMTKPIPSAQPADPMLPIPSGLTGVLLAALPFGLLVFMVSWSYLQRRSTPDVLARVERYTARSSDVVAVRSRASNTSLLARLLTPIGNVGEHLFGSSAFFARTRARAEQAAIAIKPQELFAAMVAMTGIGVLLSLLIGHPLLYVMLPLLFGFLPNAWLRYKAKSRRVKFDDQLADVLQGISSSLKAGHSFNQALIAISKDAPNPTAEEISRVMTEARLGMPTEDALQHMADRMGSADFDFAVTTVNIQRTVGGSLADILEMVGDTVRHRQQFRKKVKALTSMGQMSAYVLLALPVFMAGFITLINRDYMMPLFTTSAGHMMMAAGAFSMFLGYLACMKIVRIKV